LLILFVEFHQIKDEMIFLIHEEASLPSFVFRWGLFFCLEKRSKSPKKSQNWKLNKNLYECLQLLMIPSYLIKQTKAEKYKNNYKELAPCYLCCLLLRQNSKKIKKLTTERRKRLFHTVASSFLFPVSNWHLKLYFWSTSLIALLNI